MPHKSPPPPLRRNASSRLPPPYKYEFERLPIGIIIGYEAIRKGLEEGRDLDEMEVGWQEELEGFLVIRKQYLLY
ncbi:MAG: hypothetical protein MUO24_00070 [Desulfobacterales bacterium]|nr:hypothetical protein [Desulfobacterales bacterium]